LRIGVSTNDFSVAKKFGFKGVGFGLLPKSVKEVSSHIEERAEQLREEGFEVAQIGAWANLVHPDTKARREHIEIVKEALRASALVGKAPVATGAGSRSGARPFSIHRENTSPATQRLLIEGLNEVAGVAEENRVYLALEPGLLTPLPTPEKIREVIEAVSSKYVGLQMDPFNLLGPETICHSGDFFRKLFEITKGLSVSAHLKDIYVEPTWPIQMKETFAGNGWADYEILLSLLVRELKPDAWAMIEHTPPEKIPEAKRFIENKAHELGIRLG